MMKKYLALMFVVLVGVVSCVYAQATRSAAASQAWVENFVTNYVANSVGQLSASVKTETANGVTTFSLGDGRLVMEEATDAALKVVRTSSAVTNGTVFVWNGGGKYFSHAGTIESTRTNLVYNGIGSTYSNGEISFAGALVVKPVLLQPSVSAAATNNLEVVR